MRQKSIKPLYTEMLLDALIHDKWEKRDMYEFYGHKTSHFYREFKWVGHYQYAFACFPKGFLAKRVTVMVYGADGANTSQDFLYPITSLIFWRIHLMEKETQRIGAKKHLDILEKAHQAYMIESGKERLKELEMAQVQLDKIHQETLGNLIREYHVKKPVTQKWEISLEESFRLQLEQHVNEKRKDEHHWPN